MSHEPQYPIHPEVESFIVGIRERSGDLYAHRLQILIYINSEIGGPIMSLLAGVPTSNALATAAQQNMARGMAQSIGHLQHLLVEQFALEDETLFKQYVDDFQAFLKLALRLQDAAAPSKVLH